MLATITTIAAVLLVAFIATYATRTWYRSPTGRSIMATKIAVLTVAVGTLLWLASRPAAHTVLTVGWSAVGIIIAWRLWMHWRDRPRDKEN